MNKQEVQLPEWLKKDYSNVKKPEVCRLLEEYTKRLNDQISTEELIMDKEELATILKKCLKENRTFSEVTGIYFDDDEDEKDDI